MLRTKRSKMNKFKRDDKFELMLTAIEENSGHIINLAKIEWGKMLTLEYDIKKELHSRIELTHLKSYYIIRDS